MLRVMCYCVMRGVDIPVSFLRLGGRALVHTFQAVSSISLNRTDEPSIHNSDFVSVRFFVSLVYCLSSQEDIEKQKKGLAQHGSL